MRNSWLVLIICEFVALVLTYVFLGGYLAGYFFIDFIIAGIVIVVIYNVITNRKKRNLKV